MIPYNGKFLYVNNNGVPNIVSGFAIKSNGTLERTGGSPFVTGGDGSTGFYAANPIAIARGKKLLFATNPAVSTITSFPLNSTTGELTAVGLPVASGGTMGSGGSLAVDDGEDFLFVGNDTSLNISVFAIAANGALTPVLGSPFALPAGLQADGVTLNLVGSVLYVTAPDVDALIAMNIAADGTLTPIAGSPFAITGIASFVLTKSTRAVSAALGGVVSSYSIDAIGAPTLLDSVLVGGNAQCISSARNGKLAIASGGGSPISVIQVATDGFLTPVTGSPFATAAATSGYAIANPSGRFLYATENSGIEAFLIDSLGALSSIDTYPLVNPGFATGLVIY